MSRAHRISAPLLLAACLAAAVGHAEDADDPAAHAVREFQQTQRDLQQQLHAAADQRWVNLTRSGNRPDAARLELALVDYLTDQPGSLDALVEHLPPAPRRQFVDGRTTALRKLLEDLDDAVVRLQNAADTAASEQTAALRAEIARTGRAPVPPDLLPYRVHGYAWDQGGWLDRLQQHPVPEQLAVETHLARFRIAGVDDVGTVDDQGYVMGHIGRAVLFDTVDRQGFLTVLEPTAADSTTYFLIACAGNEPVLQIPLWIVPERLYRWEFWSNDEWVGYAVRDAGRTIVRGRLRQADDLRVGFAATTRYRGNRADVSLCFFTDDRP